MAVYSVNNSNGRFTLRLTLTEGTPSTADNNSPVSYKLELIANTSYNFELYGITSKINFDGVEVHSAYKQYSIAKYGTLLLAEGSKTINHNTDGSKTLSFSYSIAMKKVDYTPGDLSSSGTMALTNIARKAEVTSATTTSFTDEQNPTVYFNNPGGFKVRPYFNVYNKYTNALVCSFSNDLGQYSSPFTFVFSDDGLNYLWNATKDDSTFAVKIGVETYNGSTSLGVSERDATLTIVNANPILTADKVSYVDANAATYALTESQGQSIVSGLSSVNVTCGAATAKKGATISQYEVSLGSAYKPILSAEGGTAELGSVTSNTDLILYVSAVDSRGNRSGTVQKNVPIFPYSEPKIAYHTNFNQIECARCDENGAIDKSGKNLKVTVQGRWSAFPNGKNIGKLQVMYSTKNTDSNWYDLSTTDIVGGSSNLYVTQGNFNGVAQGITLDVAKSYTITIRCIDSLGKSAKVSYKIPTKAVDFHLKKGASFGEYVTEYNALKLSNEWIAIGLLGLGKCTQLTGEADVNDCLDFRVYGISSSAASKIKNLPENVFGTIRVYSGDGLGMSASDYINIIQEFTTGSGSRVYRRRVRKDVANDEWTYYAWQLCQGEVPINN